MRPLLVPPDPERAIVDYLTARLRARGDQTAVGTDLPADWTVRSADFVMVADDGGTLLRRVHYRHTVRVTVWSSVKSRGRILAGLCLGLLLCHPGDELVAGVPEAGGLLLAVDPTTKGRMASFTATVNLLAQPPA